MRAAIAIYEHPDYSDSKDIKLEAKGVLCAAVGYEVVRRTNVPVDLIAPSLMTIIIAAICFRHDQHAHNHTHPFYLSCTDSKYSSRSNVAAPFPLKSLFLAYSFGVGFPIVYVCIIIVISRMPALTTLL
ncbi:hypothetical protein BDN71DRAFT_693917 [Pleurotus eryngii]|uniref:Uncharacterized protein n=1 Tax=Pleurotus eryngii TaxID=5323 RepID=A0A9P6A8R2_PLEER|nr:hypothetical protein BDN71DRAFT_693917 [Pleurotus eryngii]